MSVTRRSFLSRATLTMLAGAALPRAFAQSTSPFFDNISAETFKPFIGDSFSVALNGRSQGSLTLTAVTQSPAAPPASASAVAGRQSSTQALDTFTLKFRRTGIPLPQETYTMSQLSLGSFPLFLVPLSTSGSSSTYIAVFNLMKA
ncbi:MAG: hypothetical protein WAL75_05345 [Terracidiphilus sp.]